MAASDTGGTIYDTQGLDYEELIKIKKSCKNVTDYKTRSIKGIEEIFSGDAEILIPAAPPDDINKENIDMIRARISFRGPTYLPQWRLRRNYRGRGFSLFLIS